MLKKNIIFILLLFIGVFLILVAMEFSGIYIFESGLYVDLNSGDCKGEKYIFSFKLKNKITTTRFSREVRRLGIDVSDERIWKKMGGHSYTLGIGGIHSVGHYNVYDAFNFLTALDINNISGDDRINAIKEALNLWKKVESEEVNNAFKDIINKYKEEK